MRSRHLLICLLALAAGLVPAFAFADGEDDPLFGTAGSAYSILLDRDRTLPVGAPFTAQAPDGSIVLAGAAIPDAVSRGSGAFATQLLVSRLSADGRPLGEFGGDGIVEVELGDLGRVVALEALDDGRIVVVVGNFDDGSTQTGTVQGSGVVSSAIVITVGADGDVLSKSTHVPPDACDADDALPRAATVSGDGSVHVLWTNCEDRDVVERLDAWTWDLPAGMSGRDLVLGPGGVFVLGQVFDGGLQRAGSDIDSRVVRLDGDGEPVAGYGGEDGAVLDGAPVRFTVGDDGRATVLVVPGIVLRGEREAWHLRRLTAAGAPDGSFGTGGLVTLEGEPFGEALSANEETCMQFVVDSCAIHQLRALSGGRVLVSGPPRDSELPVRGVSAFGESWTVARLAADGALDAGWDGDGVKSLAFPPNELRPFFFAVGRAALQGDGKVLLPFVTVADEPPGEERVAVPSPGIQYGVQRLGLSGEKDPDGKGGGGGTATDGGTTAAQQPAAPAGTPAAARSASPKRCVSRRRFSIRLRTGKSRSRIVSASVTVNGRKAAVRRRGATINLRGLPAGRFTVRIRVRLADGTVVPDTRRYRTCAKKTRQTT